MKTGAWPPVRWGERTITVVSDGALRLDGGAMFGVVPKVLWESRQAPDERNRIRLAMNALVIDGPDGRTLVELGAGDKEGAKFADQNGLERDGGIPARLAEIGVETASIDDVVVTHLHWDHAGGGTRFGADGETIEPTYPNATYHFHRGEYEAALGEGARNEASYLLRDFEPLVERGVVRWVENGSQVGDGITILETPGHTAHHCSIAVGDGEGADLVFLGDLVPTTHHLAYPWIMAYDLYPVQTLETKKRVLPRAVDEGWLCAFVHDADTPLAYLAVDDRGRVVLDGARDPWTE